jgi:hypothetical protein
MRGVITLAVGVLACGCSSSKSSGSTGPDGGDAGPSCGPDELVLEGPTAETPHGYYTLSDVSLTNDAFSAVLPGGGEIQLSWSGDATSGPVSVFGQIAVATGPTTMSSWCLASPSTLQIRGTIGTLDLRVLASDGACDAVNDAGSDYESIVACFDTSSDGDG